MAGNFCLPRRSASLITLSLLFFGLFCAEHSSEKKVGKFGVTIEFKFIIIVATFLDEKS